MAERFCSIMVSADSHFTDKLCALLESHQIPVMVEHLTIPISEGATTQTENSDSQRLATGFRILTPASMCGTALSLVKGLRQAHELRAA